MELTEEEDECDAVQDQDVGDVVDVRVAEELHLLLCCTHEEESGGVEQLQACQLNSKRALKTTAYTRSQHTNGGRYWKLFGSDPSGLSVLRSFKMNEISMILVAPAAIKV